MTERGVAEINGTRLVYEVGGEGPALHFRHGLTLDKGSCLRRYNGALSTTSPRWNLFGTPGAIHPQVPRSRGCGSAWAFWYLFHHDRPLVRDRAEADAIENVVRGPGSQSGESLFGPFGIRYASGADGAIRENLISGYLSDQPGSSACAIAIDLDAGDMHHGPNTFPSPGNASNVCIGTPPEGWSIPKPRATPAATPEP
jgi:hypothetical protein